MWIWRGRDVGRWPSPCGSLGARDGEASMSTSTGSSTSAGAGLAIRSAEISDVQAGDVDFLGRYGYREDRVPADPLRAWPGHQVEPASGQHPWVDRAVERRSADALGIASRPRSRRVTSARWDGSTCTTKASSSKTRSSPGPTWFASRTATESSGCGRTAQARTTLVATTSSARRARCSSSAHGTHAGAVESLHPGRVRPDSVRDARRIA